MPPLDTTTFSGPQGLVSISSAPAPRRFNTSGRPRRHPLAEEAHRHTVDWAWDQGLVEPWSELFHRFCGAHFGAVAARLFPTVTAPQLDLAADLLTWLFFYGESLDDNIATHPVLYAEAIETERHFVKVLTGATLPDRTAPLSRSLGDLRRRLLREAGCAGSFDRFARGVERHLQGRRWQRLLGEGGQTPGLTTYRRLRLMAGTAAPLAELAVLFVGGPEGGAHVGSSLEHLKVLAANSANWAEELALEEPALGETSEASTAVNLVQVLRHEHDCPLAEAREKAMAMCDRELQRFTELASYLACATIADPGVLSFVRALESMVRGHFDGALGEESVLTVH